MSDNPQSFLKFINNKLFEGRTKINSILQKFKKDIDNSDSLEEREKNTKNESIDKVIKRDKKDSLLRLLGPDKETNTDLLSNWYELENINPSHQEQIETYLETNGFIIHNYTNSPLQADLIDSPIKIPENKDEQKVSDSQTQEEAVNKLIINLNGKKNIEETKLLEWFIQENISSTNQEYLLKYLNENSYNISESPLQYEDDSNMGLLIDFINENLKFGSQVSVEELNKLFNNFPIAENEKEHVYQELELLHIKIVNSDSFSNEEMGYDTSLLESEEVAGKPVKKLIAYIENHLKFGSSISDQKLFTLFDEFNVDIADQQYIYEELNSLEIAIIKTQYPYQKEIEQLLAHIGESREIRETLLNEWYRNFNVGLDGQTIIRTYIDSNGYSVINDVKKKRDTSRLNFLEDIESKSLDEILDSQEFKKEYNSFEEVINKKYNTDYLINYSEGDFELKLDAMDKLVKANKGLVSKVVSKYKRFETSSYSEEDMFQAGMMGLMEAAERFDLNLGNQFSTYATYWIRQKITRGIENDSTTIRVPVHMREQIRKYVQIKNNYWSEYNEILSINKIADLMNLEVDKVRDIQTYSLLANITSLDVPVGEDRSGHLGEFIMDKNNITPEEHMENEILKGEIRQIFHEKLTKRESEVLKRRFGLAGHEKHTLEQIGEEFGVTRERIRQIEKKALTKIGEGISGERLKIFAEDSR
ncbi:sigma-70 family RNA polymerase sigma factor [Aerococcus urinaeequi]|uniref:sigma-70 family RNA polymerase sigma factor n=1 Tax=Aerococcus urinaeequi TaxID=51665 RepID=UPI003EC7EA49